MSDPEELLAIAVAAWKRQNDRIEKVLSINPTVHESWNLSPDFAAGWKACLEQVYEALEINTPTEK